MQSDRLDQEKLGVSPEIYRELSDASPETRAQLILKLIEAHPQGRLVLPSDEKVTANLEEVKFDLERLRQSIAQSSTPPSWWNDERGGISLREADLEGARLNGADLHQVDLTRANLRRANLTRAHLSNTILEQADLSNADCLHASFKGALLWEANLQGAMLEEADLQQASLRFARLENAVLESAQLQQADLWGAHLRGADINNANLTRAILHEAHLAGANLSLTNLEGALLSKADLSAVNLQGANLQHTVLMGANLAKANLKECRLQGLDLTSCNITNVFLADAWLEKTRIRLTQIGGAIGEELAGDFEGARLGYLALERNFTESGDSQAARWSYLRRRRMQKRANWQQAKTAWQDRHWLIFARQTLRYVNEQLVEWLCDYGESTQRVLFAIFLVFLGFSFLYGLTGSVVRLQETPTGPVRVPTSNPIDLATFSLLAMSTSGSPVVGLLPSHQWVHLLTALQALLSIALTGLLGFVLGNRIHR